ncbi:MAG: hypothetical protein U9N31_05435 [Candidatus Marinimicrobia bacterium]|nr:hypothetical protein [Candidatus Neomarinimicrobiota bacterium]
MARIAGITQGGSLKARLAFLYSKWKFGKVTTPLRITAIHSKLFSGYGQMEWAQSRAKQVSWVIKSLAEVRVATRIGCPF